ncbi:hypothetical protein BDF20DRAFT_838671 [Mycotypha africana]|uniref:uncharacterized protein n=1 Tax=Mycotypha africana TaxID=64632 RepID=UPI00230154A9|nr:uncharacterized protein BDF20DRAFT_838671 [Mycotypha africana]KAI8970301.1 hypothetical protein BDF20DRAFT_838671 [Mycotypha africana]
MAIFSKFSKLGSNDKAIYPWSQRKIGGSHNALPRFGHSAVMLDSRFFVVYGGTHKGLTKKNLFYIDTNNMSANSVTTAGDLPSPRSFASLIMMDTFLILYGGEPINPNEIWDPHFYVLQINTRQWSRVRTKGRLPTERAGHSACISEDGIMYIWGGHYHRKYMNDLCAFNVKDYPAKAEWNFIEYKNSGPTPRSGHISIIYEGKFYVFGGINSSHLYNDIWSFDLTIHTWEKLTAVGYIPAPRESCAAALVDDTIYIFGGRGLNGCILGDLCAFKIKSKRWYMFQSMGIPPSPRYGHTLTVFKNKLYVFGGDTDSEKNEDSTHVFTLDCAKIRYPPEPAVAKNDDSIESSNGDDPNVLSAKIEVQQKIGCMHHQQKDISPPLSPIPNSTKYALENESHEFDEKAQQFATQKQQPLRIDTTSVKPNVRKIRHTLTSPPTPPRPAREGAFLKEEFRQPKNAVPMLDAEMKPKRHSSLRHHYARLRTNKCNNPLPPTPPPVSSDSFMEPNEKNNLIKEIMTRDAIITEMKKKEQWWRTEVSIARHLRRSQGEQFEEDELSEMQAALMRFSDSESENNSTTDKDGNSTDEDTAATIKEKLLLFQYLVDAKGEIRKLRNHMNKQNQPLLNKLEEIEEIKQVAEKEAAYYKAKYMALKSYDDEASEQLEAERTKILEKRLMEAYEEQKAIYQTLKHVQEQSEQEKEARLLAEEKTKEAQKQSEEAQTIHQQLVKQLAELYEQTVNAEAQLRDDAAQIAELSKKLAEQIHEKESISEDLSRVHTEIGRLEAANLQLGQEAAILMKKLQDSRDDEIELRIMLNEKDEAYTKAVQQLEVAHIELELLKHMSADTSPSTLLDEEKDEQQQQLDSNRSDNDTWSTSSLTMDADSDKIYTTQQLLVNSIPTSV